VVFLDPAYSYAGKQTMKNRKLSGPEMSGQKQSGTGATEDEDESVMRLIERKPLRSWTAGPHPPGSGPTTTAPDGARKMKRRGRLDRAVLTTLGKGLEDCFDEVRKQEVPERFKLLLDRF
jgi:hypothetical protein